MPSIWCAFGVYIEYYIAIYLQSLTVAFNLVLVPPTTDTYQSGSQWSDARVALVYGLIAAFVFIFVILPICICAILACLVAGGVSLAVTGGRRTRVTTREETITTVPVSGPPVAAAMDTETTFQHKPPPHYFSQPPDYPTKPSEA